MICFMIKYGFVAFRKDARVTQLPHVLKRSAYIFMFNKTIVLLHHFFRLFNLFLYILMKYFVNSYLHMYSYYPQGKKVRTFKKRTAATFGYV